MAVCAQRSLQAARNLWVRNLWNTVHRCQKFSLFFCKSSIFSESSFYIPLSRIYCSYKFSSRLLDMLGKNVYCLFFYLLQTVPQSLFGFPYYLFTLNLPEFIILFSSYGHDASFLKDACKMQAIQERGNPTSREIKNQKTPFTVLTNSLANLII